MTQSTHTALVTGASAGLGLEFARLLAADKHDLVLVARRKDKLDEVKAKLTEQYGVKVHTLSADLLVPGAPARIVEELGRLGLTIDVLVNNAGFGNTGAFAAADASKELGMIEVNVTALVALTHALVPGMISRGYGRILNVGSTAGFSPGPFMAVYYASKAFVNSFSEALSFELEDSGVTATLSCPGPVATEFGAVAGNASSKLFESGVAKAADVAQEAYDAMKRGDARVIHGMRFKLLEAALSPAPRRFVKSVTASLNRTPEKS